MRTIRRKEIGEIETKLVVIWGLDKTRTPNLRTLFCANGFCAKSCFAKTKVRQNANGYILQKNAKIIFANGKISESLICEETKRENYRHSLIVRLVTIRRFTHSHIVRSLILFSRFYPFLIFLYFN